MKVNHTIESFAAGQISPRMWGRLSTEGYKQGLADCKNMITDPRGPIRNRPSTHWFNTITGQTQANAFVFSTPQYGSFIVVIYHNAIEVYNADDLSVTGASPVYTTTGAWTAAQVDGVKATITPNITELWFVHENVAPQGLSYNGSTWSFGAISFTAQPAQWTGTDFPSALTFFQGRSWWGGVATYPEDFWASQSGSLKNMTIGATDSDGMRHSLSRHARIAWMEGAKNFLIGTDNSEFIVTSDGGVITPSDINVEQQSAYGGKNIQTRLIGNETLYVTPDGRKLRSMWYAWTESGWVSQDLSELSEDITEGIIKDITFARNPDSTAWCVTDDGKLLSCSYRKASGTKAIIGWHHHTVTDRTILNLDVLEVNGTSVPIVITTNGTDIFVESMQVSPFIMDSQVLETSGGGTTEVSGLDHMEGEEVWIIADGAVRPSQTVSGGIVDLGFEWSTAYVGLPIAVEIVTLPIGNIEAKGVPIFSRRRWNKIFVRVFDSAKPQINGKRAPERHPSSPMNLTEPTRTENVQGTLLGWESEGQVTVMQDIPMPLTIINMSGELDFETL